MAELARGPDYLKQHVNLGRRVTNLETGVHPTSAGVGYADTWFPEDMPDQSSILSNAGSGAGAKASRRSGHVHLFGKVTGNLSSIDLAAGEKWSTLPGWAIPDEEQQQMATASVAPYFVRVVIKTNGEVWVFAPIATMGAGEIAFDNISYPVG